MVESPQPGCLTVSAADLLVSFRRLEFLQHLLEVSLGLVVFGSVAAAVLVRAPGHAGVVGGALIAASIALARALAIAGLRQRTGARVVAVHGSGRWLVVGPREGDRGLGWSADLRQPALPRGPLLLPGLALVASTLVLALAARWPEAAEPPAGFRSPALFLAALLLLHQAAAAAVAHHPARRRLRLGLPWLILTVAIAALVPFSMGPHPAWRLASRLPPWPPTWPDAVRLALGAWALYAAFATVRRDALVLATLAGLLALGALAAEGPAPHVWASFAVVAALGRVGGTRP